ncbi:MAG: hypothetical protein HON70_41855, partial [Lentisphaerae bacterium]|nr:hypothetical protein [Lentisphaerota bacterium]
KLYRMPVGEPVFEAPPEHLALKPATPVLSLDLAGSADGRVADESEHGHHAMVSGDLPVVEDGVQCGAGFARVEGHADFAFARGAFYVRADVFIESNPKRLQLIVVGDYPEHRQGWQIFINTEGRPYFNSRDPSGRFVGATVGAPLPGGAKVTLIGVRDARGDISLLVRGDVVAEGRATGATMSYGTPNQVRIGGQFNGDHPFAGRLCRLEVGTGIPPERRATMLTLREVLSK